MLPAVLAWATHQRKTTVSTACVVPSAEQTTLPNSVQQCPNGLSKSNVHAQGLSRRFCGFDFAVSFPAMSRARFASMESSC